uniref:SAM-dependent methyltransferase n=1 Tax=Schlesneria paludicola TaxID=360056 RepID=A0A7C4QX94_9PLAN
MRSSTDWQSLLASAVASETLWRLVLSRPLADVPAAKITVRPVHLRNQVAYQAAERRGTQEFHDNLPAPELVDWVRRRFGRDYGDLHWFSAAGDFTARWKGPSAVSLKRKPPSRGPADLAHNRQPSRLIPEGEPVPFLVAVGVMTADGRVKPSMAHKFRQINRYLEFLEDVWPHLPSDGVVRVVDFGCGKSYLTFALHHWLTRVHERPVDIVGLDRKHDVLRECAGIAQRLHCRGLRFAPGEIHTFVPTAPVHLAISLHACDTATDDALAAAVRWDCPVILAVPCCQHELNQLLPASTLPGLTGFGLFRERFAAMATDALRARWLEMQGYRTQVLEFIETEHTPKNVLLRAVKRPRLSADELARCRENYEEFKRSIGIQSWHLERAALHEGSALPVPS